MNLCDKLLEEILNEKMIEGIGINKREITVYTALLEYDHFHIVNSGCITDDLRSALFKIREDKQFKEG